MKRLVLHFALAFALLPACVLAWSGATLVDEDKPTHKSTVTPGADSYAVQVGRFQNEDKALELAASLRQKGHNPHVLGARESGGKLWYAVRLGLYDSLREARKAAKAFSKENASPGAVVAISGSTSPVSEAATLYFLQAGAFMERKHAVERMQQYKDMGFEPGLIKLFDNNNDPWFIVFTQTLHSEQAARKAATAFREKTGEDCYINAIAPQLFQQRLQKVE